jgi:hypothetical protein
MLLLNVLSHRQLREGDTVRTRTGAIGRVVGVDVFESESLLVQDSNGETVQVSPNEVDFVQEGPAGMEPLPSVVTILSEGKVKNSVRTCAGAVCLTLTETNTTLTLFPKNPNSNLRESLQKLLSGNDFAKAIMTILKEAYVTRLPHLLESGPSKVIDSVLGKDVGEAIREIEKTTE